MQETQVIPFHEIKATDIGWVEKSKIQRIQGFEMLGFVPQSNLCV
jgi:hypothetical protein